ncbi:hypothetical protein LSTR_LSTR015871 [Laodelphax striatellus]|uniref:Uncharacterized protein n=1 Tax=Laodelphax striatellus TaxID=195883 RepID=A0A482XL06_LAOST|nr:hypothetical protein LSTR_LSTR015871 [Laodelphax striatellus]
MWAGLSGDKFHFAANGDGPARYNIIHFKQISPGNFHWVNVGQYINGELHLDMPAIQFKLAEPMLPESVCSLPCEWGFFIINCIWANGWVGLRYCGTRVATRDWSLVTRRTKPNLIAGKAKETVGELYASTSSRFHKRQA